jgi:Tfp pilus assembly pilus retraction ATPase PilT
MTPNEKFEKCIQLLINAEGSDLHIREDRLPYLRAKKKVEPAVEIGQFTRQDILELLRTFLAQEKLEVFSKEKSVDFSHISLGRRLRGNAFIERGRISITLRLIPLIKKTLYILFTYNFHYIFRV